MTLNVRAKLTLGVSVILLLLLALSVFLSVSRFREALVAEIFREQFAMLESVAEELDTRLGTAHLVLMAAAETLPLAELADADRAQAVLDSRADLHRVFDNHVFVFTPQGRLFAESPFVPGRRGKDFAFREYIRRTLASDRPFISDPYISSQAHRHPVIMMTAPVRDRNGRLVAILAASLDLMRDNLLGKLAQRKVGRDGYFYLTTGGRELVLHPDRTRIFKPVPEGVNLGYDAAVAGFQGSRETVTSYGRRMYASFKRLQGKDWILAVNYPVEEALAPLEEFRAQVLLLAVLGLAASALVIHAVMGRLLRPMRELASHMDALPGLQGDERLLPETAADETGRLTRSFNEMVRALDEQKAALQRQESLYRTLVSFTSEFIFWRGPDGAMRFVSETALEVTGYPAEEFYANPRLLDDIVHPEDRARWQSHIQQPDGELDCAPLELRIITAGGETRWVSHLCQQVLDEAGGDQGLRGSHTDITARKQSEARLRLAGVVFDSTREAVLVTDAKSRIVAVNPAFTRMTGYTEAEVLGRNPSLLKSGAGDPEVYAEMWRGLEQHGAWQGEFSNRHKNGQSFHALAAISAVRDEQGRVTHYVGIESDISAMKEAEERIEHLAYHDPLTGLANRALLMERAHLALALAQRRREQAAILFLDLDHFKNVNDSLGHAAGDALLQEAGRRLLALVRETDTVSRLGGDEFVLLLLGVGREDAQSLADKVLLAMREPFAVDSHQLVLSTSVGIALFPQDGADMAELLKNADTALYRAKQEGRNASMFYERQMSVASFEQLVLETELRQGLERGELTIHYQPKVWLEDGRLAGAEALVRWRHPQHGLVLPGRFLPVAEASGLISEICQWVLQEVCRQMAEWSAQGLPPLTLGVNLSGRDFRGARLPERLQGALASHGLPPGALELELTESILLEAGEQVLRNLLAIKHLGIGLAIDDFGTGYSSLSYLRRLPISSLKIDRSFVQYLESDPEDRVLAGSIVALGNSLGLRVVAEGVETPAQRDLLLQLGCQLGQGYLFSPALPADAFRAWLAKGGVPEPRPDS